MQKTLLALAVLASNSALANTSQIEEVTIIGNPEEAQQLSGPAHVLSKVELEKFDHSDINRIVRSVPGVYLQEEDGFGLRPNIGIRAAVGERSAKINLLEDGVLIAPAPYSAPSAYYFPVAARMSTVEVLKGSETLRQGPATVGGAINLLSTPIANDNGGSVKLEAGEDGAYRAHAHYSVVGEQVAALIETHQQSHDGFKDIDRSGRDTGYYIQDYVAKLRLHSAPDARFNQQLDIKFQYSEELSDETYLGLSDADFNADPDRRYGLSQFDEMNTYHAGAYIRHRIELRPELSLNTTIYRNQFKRDWYKVKGVGGLIDDVNQGNDNAANAQAILNGQADLDKAAVKYNNRDYTSEGIQMTLDWELGQHQLEMGARYHEDDVSRYQPEDIYQQINGQLQFDYQKAPSSSNNRYEKAEALALHLMDRWQLNDKLTLNLGLRYEDIDTAQTRYANAERSEVASRRSNQISELLYSAGATYAINDNWQLLGGVHEGFSPTSPSARENIDPETSTNYDLGLRYFGERLNASVIGFYSDFASSVTNCSVARPCGDQTSGARSQGEAEVQGLEVTASAQLYQGDNLSIPLQLSYTYTDAEITNPKDGDNLAGDVYAYVPENQFYTQLGVELDNGIAGYLSASYVDEMCTDNLACGRNGVDQRFIYTDDYWVVDVSGHWQVNPSTKLYLKVDNLLDKRAIVSRHPDGARPNKPRSASIGVSFNF